MNRLFALMSLLACVTATLISQPMSGTYTIGGTLPDFAALQNAANTVKSRGVSGPVFFNIRPGIYVREDRMADLMIIDSTIVGTSPTSRITFQPDEAAGGNVDNVILEADFNTSSPSYLGIARVEADYITFRNLTFKDAASTEVPASFLIRINAGVGNATVEDIVVTGCKFFGSPYFAQGFGTPYALEASGELTGIRVTGNIFKDLNYGMNLGFEGAPQGVAFDVENNRFDSLYLAFTGSGNALGSAVQIVCEHPTVRNNFVAHSNGSHGIYTSTPVSGVIEQNYIQGSYFDYINVTNASRADSMSVVNNIVIAGGGARFGILQVETPHTKILHNTMIYSGAFGETGLYLEHAPGCVVLNNILVAYGPGCLILCDESGATNLVSDHNVFYSSCGHFVGYGPGGQLFSSFDGYRTITGLDSNSAFKDISFDSDSLGIHLDECQAQDPALDGTPQAGVHVDYYGARRDSVRPFVGAVEGVRIPFNMFAAPFRSALPGYALSLATGRFENASPPGIVVADYDSRQVHVFHNNGANRTFTQSGTVFTAFRPTVVRLADFDNDNNLDLIVGGDTNAVSIFWGDGAGGFSAPSTVTTRGRVRSLEPLLSGIHSNTLWVTEDNGFLPTTSFLGNIVYLGNRQICHDLLQRAQGVFYVDDTIPAVTTALALVNLDTDSPYQIATLGFDGSEKFFVFHALESLFASPCEANGRLGFAGWDTTYQFGTSSYLGFGSNIAWGDFDGDGKRDFITTGASEDNCIFIKNQGQLAFTVDTISTNATRGLVALDYDNDGHLDFVTVNRTLDSAGITVFLNDGTGRFTEKKNCYLPFASGTPAGVIAEDFDLDGKTDIAIVSRSIGGNGNDSLFVLYNLGGFNTTTGVHEPPASGRPQELTLLQNYPNPFNPSTTITYQIPSASHVVLKIYNILGQQVASLVDEDQAAGSHALTWNGRSSGGTSVSSGVYFYRIEATSANGQGSFVSVKKMMLLK